MESIMIDLTEQFNKTYNCNALKVQGEGRNVLILTNMGYTTPTLDGHRGSYELEHRWLSEDVNTNIDSFACVKGQDWIYLRRKEVEKALKPDANLFDCFSLTG